VYKEEKQRRFPQRCFFFWHGHLAFLRRKNDFFFYFLRFHIKVFTLQYAGLRLPVRGICGMLKKKFTIFRFLC